MLARQQMAAGHVGQCGVRAAGERMVQWHDQHHPVFGEGDAGQPVIIHRVRRDGQVQPHL